MIDWKALFASVVFTAVVFLLTLGLGYLTHITNGVFGIALCIVLLLTIFYYFFKH